MESGYKKAVGNLTSQIDTINKDLHDLNIKIMKMESNISRNDQNIEKTKNSLQITKDLCIKYTDELEIKIDDKIIDQLNK